MSDYKCEVCGQPVYMVPDGEGPVRCTNHSPEFILAHVVPAARAAGFAEGVEASAQRLLAGTCPRACCDAERARAAKVRSLAPSPDLVVVERRHVESALSTLRLTRDDDNDVVVAFRAALAALDGVLR